MTKALLIVDVQNDFCEGGALAVQGGAAVAERIGQHLTRHRDDYDLIVASRDWHDPDNDNGGHFAAEPDYSDTWPVHCVAGTEGARFHRALAAGLIGVHIFKGQGQPAYSAFEGTTRGGRNLASVLAVEGIDAVDVVGIATDYCVKASALDAAKFGVKTRVLTGLTAGVAAASTETALADLRDAGVEVA